MLNSDSLRAYDNFLKKIGASTPHVHVVLGSGFGEALITLNPEWNFMGEIGFSEIPGLVSSTVQDHKGAYRVYFNNRLNKTIQFQMGRIHGYEGHSSQTVIKPVLLPRLSGVSRFILTNAAGGLDKNMNPGDAMIITDHVNLTGHNPLIGENPKDTNNTPLGPRFPDMGNCYSTQNKNSFKKSLLHTGCQVHEGVYLGLLGPSFETHAEVKLFASWGLGAVGMSTVWETITLKHSGAQVMGLSLISNLGAGLSAQALDHESIVETCRKSASQIVNGIVHFIENSAF